MNKQKLTLFVAICLALGLCNSVRAQGGRPSYPQNENCVGLKNPSNFEFVGGATNSQWNGFVGGTGCKQSTLSTCTTPGFCSLTPVANASQLESQSSSSCSNSPISYNIDNVQDNSKRFVIKGPGTDPFTGNNLPYLPPDTSFHTSIRLGNYCWNGEVEMLTYQMDIRPENALVTIWYALSLEYAGHPQGQNPEFSITIEKQVKEVYGGDGVDYTPEAAQKLAAYQADPETARLPVCIAKTQYSLSHDPKLLGRPKGWRLPVKDVLIYRGAGLLVPVAGEIKLMPGTSASPAYRRIDVDVETGHVKGLF